MRTAEQVAARKRWAYGLLRKCKIPAPQYGSSDWLALPLADPARIAAVVIAAECWAIDDDDPEARLSTELDSLRHAFKQADDEEYRARAEEHRRSAPKPARSSFDERRAAQLEAVKPRAGDYPGRRKGSS